MATVQDVQDRVAAVQADVARVDALVQELKDSQGVATQAELDAIDAAVAAAQASLAAVVK